MKLKFKNLYKVNNTNNCFFFSEKFYHYKIYYYLVATLFDILVANINTKLRSRTKGRPPVSARLVSWCSYICYPFNQQNNFNHIKILCMREQIVNNIFESHWKSQCSIKLISNIHTFTSHLATFTSVKLNGHCLQYSQMNS